MNFKKTFLSALFAGMISQISFGAIIGTNVPATPLTAARVANLPAWKNYFENSAQQQKADRDFFQAELKKAGLENPIVPPGGNSAKSIPLENDASWFASADARRIADIVVSFQTPAGGWSKNLDMTKHLRAPGESFTVDNRTRFVVTNDFDQPEDASWNYVGTFDNDATTTQLRFLTKVIAANKNNSAWQKSFARGLKYIFAAQFPNGGWPQVWPLQGGYHDEITFNDDAMLHVVEFLRDAASGQNEFSFVPSKLRAQANASWKRGLNCILAAQVIVNGQRTVLCQQNDAITLQPASARNYEMPSLTSSESAEIVLFLMQLPDPNSNVVAAVHGACAWFEKTKILDEEFKGMGSDGKKLVAAPGAGPIWARYYEIGTDRPIFGDRDKTIHDDVNEISRERRNGYGWFRDTPKRVLEHYKKWAQENPLK